MRVERRAFLSEGERFFENARRVAMPANVRSALYPLRHRADSKSLTEVINFRG
jgi:hypothetical protein